IHAALRLRTLARGTAARHARTPTSDGLETRGSYVAARTDASGDRDLSETRPIPDRPWRARARRGRAAEASPRARQPVRAVPRVVPAPRRGSGRARAGLEARAC